MGKRLLAEPLGWLVLVGLVTTAPPQEVRGNTVILGMASAGNLTTTMAPIQQTSFLPALGIAFLEPDYGSAFSALVFDLSFIPQGTTISSAVFTMSVNQALPGTTLYIYEYAAPSNVITQQNIENLGLNAIAGGFSFPTNPPGGTYDNVSANFNVTSFIQSMVTDGTPYAAFGFYTSEEGSASIPGTTAPSLMITSPSFLTVPEPPGALLLALGLSGLTFGVWLRGRKARHGSPAMMAAPSTPASGGAAG